MSNVDTHHVLHHAAFYKIITGNALKQTQLYFHEMVMNSPAVCTFRIENVCQKDLEFDIEGSVASIEIFSIGDGDHRGTPAKDSPRSLFGASQTQMAAMRFERNRFLENMTWGSPDVLRASAAVQSRVVSSARAHSQSEQSQRLQGMDLANVAACNWPRISNRPSEAYHNKKATDLSSVWSITQLCKHFEDPFASAEMGGCGEKEEDFGKQDHFLAELAQATADGRLRASNRFRVLVGSHVTVVVKFTPIEWSGRGYAAAAKFTPQYSDSPLDIYA